MTKWNCCRITQYIDEITDALENTIVTEEPSRCHLPGPKGPMDPGRGSCRSQTAKTDSLQAGRALGQGTAMSRYSASVSGRCPIKDFGCWSKQALKAWMPTQDCRRDRRVGLFPSATDIHRRLKSPPTAGPVQSAYPPSNAARRFFPLVKRAKGRANEHQCALSS
jgi:hypothetical protein